MIIFRMTKLFLFAALLFCCLSCARPADSRALPSERESIEWCDIWIAHADETNLPRVLLIGDSITRDYYSAVAERLAGRAYLARLATSRFVSDPVLLKEIDLVLDENQFDVIHFNNGMHGWRHTEAEYRAAFPRFLQAIQSHAPHAKLIWATTTPLKQSPSLPNGDPTQPSDERIALRNKIALECINNRGIAVDDLNTLVQGHPEYHRDNVHFNERGIDLQAAQVVASIEGLLAR